MMRDENRWASRFSRLLDTDYIQRKARQVPSALVDPNHKLPELVCSQLKSRFEQIFVPTKSNVSVLQSLFSRAHAHASLTYQGKKEFLQAIYAKSPPLPQFSKPVCLTGLSGVGKSSLIKAFKRLAPWSQEVHVDSDHPPFPLRSSWHISVRESPNLSQILLSLLEDDTCHQKDRYKLLNTLRIQAFRSGISLLTIDEFQYVTKSENANATATSILLSLSSLGLPFIYVANFSMCHRLVRRPQEDNQRLTTDPLVVLPEDPESADWKGIVSSFANVAPDIFRPELAQNADVLHGWTAGINRLLGELLCLGYRYSNGSVGINDVERAFKSTQYSQARNDITALHQQYVTGRAVRKDLWCPFDLPKHTADTQRERAREEMKSRVAAVLAESSLTDSERKLLGRLRTAAKDEKDDRRRKIIEIGEGRKGKLNLDDLRKGEEWIRSRK